VHEALKDFERRSLLVSRWRKGCHPNVVLINAIDEQHFKTVHNVPGNALILSTQSLTPTHFRVENTAAPPRSSWLWRIVSRVYGKDKLCYEIDYFSGATGCVRFGPRWARLHLLFATRMTEDGGAQGVTLALTPKSKGVFGPLIDALWLRVAALGGAYFAVGDTKVFNSIRFDLQTPIPADRTVRAYVRHVEGQPLAGAWRDDRAPLKAVAE